MLTMIAKDKKGRFLKCMASMKLHWIFVNVTVPKLFFAFFNVSCMNLGLQTLSKILTKTVKKKLKKIEATL